MRYKLIPNREGWPDEIPVEDGQHVYDLDVIEEEVDQDWIEKRRQHCHNEYRKRFGEIDLYTLSKILSKPMRFNKNALPKDMELIPDDNSV